MKKGGSAAGVPDNEQRFSDVDISVVPEKNVIQEKTAPGDALQNKIENRGQGQKQYPLKGKPGASFMISRYRPDQRSKQQAEIKSQKPNALSDEIGSLFT
jgi:selenophosphate synthetase-related protein